MTDIIVGEIVRVVISYSGDGASIAQNVFWFECQVANAAPQTALTEVGEWFEDNWLTQWALLSSSLATAFLLEMDIINGDGTVNRNIGDYDLDVSGATAEEILPAAVSGYMQADTERSNSLGRKFIPFLTEPKQANGVWNAAALTLLATLLTDLLEVIVINLLSDFAPGVLSRVTDTFQEFTGSGYTTNIPAYQRRRKPNVGS